ncbi:MAG: 4-phosphoerythronate dehydrogenase PdxB [Parabacteroides sp.]
MRIIADNTIPYLKGIAEPIAEVTYLDSKSFTPERVKEADVLIVRSIDKCTPALLAGSRVKLITTATIGFDHIDIHYCERQGIVWKNAPGCNASSVAQYVLADLVTLSLRTGSPLRGKTIGIVGVGHVGRIVERYCAAMGMRVLRNDPPRAAAEGAEGFVSLEQIAAEADVVTLHVPFTKEGDYPTYHLVDARFLQQLAKQPWLFNSCRGAVHDTEALLEAKRIGKVSELVLDCWENEPVISRELLALTALATPHIAGFSADGKANGTRACLQAIEQFFDVHFERLPQVQPPAPQDPLIDLDQWTSHRIEQAILHTFSPERVDQALRADPDGFERQRNHYAHPREFSAYQVLHATAEEANCLRQLGFVLPEPQREPDGFLGHKMPFSG